MNDYRRMNSKWTQTITYIALVVIFVMSSVIYGARFFGFDNSDIPVARAASDFKTQMVKITIPASSTSTTATAPTNFVAVTTTSTIALISGVTQHAKGYINTSDNQTPEDISTAVELTNGSTITVTRSASVSTTTTVWVLLIEYVGAASGADEFIVRDRRVHTWTNGVTSDTYGAITSVGTTGDVVVFNGGAVNPNSNENKFHTGDIKAYIDGSKVVQLVRGAGNGAAESSHQVVEFTGSNWTIQTGDIAPDNPAQSVSVTAVSAISDVWVYHNWESDSGNVDDRGHRLWLSSTTNLQVEETGNGGPSPTKTIRWYLIENTDLNVQTGAADAQFLNDLTNTITGFTAVAETGRSFAWVTGHSSTESNRHPRDMWQFELSDDSTISLERGRSGASLNYRYQIVELPVGANPSLEQYHYHWRNDDGSETTATSATGGSEDTDITDLNKNTTRRLRLQVSNEGGATSSSTAFRLEYAEKNTTCAVATGWTQVGAGGASWEMSNTVNITDGSNTTNISVANGGTTDENTTFKSPNAALKDTSSQVAAMTLTSSEFVEMEFSIKATVSASNGGTYCFRVTDAGTDIDSYIEYPEATLFTDNDFKIQRGSTLIDGATTATITAGVDYDVPGSLSSAFIRITNTHMTGAGRTVGSGNQFADAVTAYISNPGNLLTSITFTRAAADDNTHIDWEIIEYIGTVGGVNEMIVRGQGTSTYGAAATAVSSSTISGVVDDTDMVGFITAQHTPDATVSSYNTGISTSAWDSVNDEIDFTRGEANSIAGIVSWAAVEYTGTNWIIQRAEHTYTLAGSTETESITAVNDLSRAFLHTQKRAGTGLNGLDEYGHEVWLSATTTVSFLLTSGSTTPSGQVSVAWVIENTQTDGTPLKVTRSNGTQTGGVAPLSLNVNIGTTTLPIQHVSIFTNNRGTSTGKNYPSPIMGVSLVSRTQYRLLITETAQSRVYRTEVVEWPSSDFVIDQVTYKFFKNNNSTDVGTAYANQNTPGATTTATEVFRLRLLLNVDDKDLETSEVDFKLQFAEVSGTCDSSFTGESYADVTASTIVKYYDNSTPVNGDTVTANIADPVNTGNTVLQTYVEANPFSNDEGSIPLGEDGLWDFALVENGVMGEITYCFRVVDSSGGLLDSYSVIPEMEVSGGELTVDIVDGTGTPVVSPSVSFSSLNVDFIGQNANGTLGTSSERIRVSNTTATSSWTLSIAANTGPTALWTGTSNTFDFNGAVGVGQMTIDPSVATLTPEGGCTSTGISLASSDSFDQGVTDSITLVTAGGTADIICYWDITGVDIDQSIPDEQPADTYTIDMTVSVIAS